MCPEDAIRIAFLSKSLPSDKPGGVSCQVHWLAQEMVRRGHGVVCYSFSPRPDDATYDHVHLTYRSRSPLARKLEPGYRFAGLDLRKFDRLHFHGDDYLCRGSARRVRTFYGSALHEALHAKNPRRFAYQSLFYLFEWVSCIRKGHLTGISRATCKALPLVTSVIPCGVPLDRFTPGGERSAHPSILFLGDLDSRKRGRMLISAFARIILQHIPTAELVVIGPQAVSGHRIRYCGQLPESALIGEYRRAWICCMPSSYEGFGVPALESMACGTPVVATINAGTAEVIQSGSDGVVCKDGDLGTALSELLQSASARESIAQRGLETVRRFSMPCIADAYVDLLSDSKGERR